MVFSPLAPLNEALQSAVGVLCRRAEVDAPAFDSYAFAPPRNPEHGDVATNAPLVLGKALKRPPLEIAGELAGELRTHPDVAAAEAARPGFVNVRLADGPLAAVLERATDRGDAYGENRTHAGERVLLEFVSANPTGPMHVGHLRHAVTGEAIARILAANGFGVHREFYINDAGAQIARLGRSFRTRCLQLQGVEVELPEDSYPGEYVTDMAREYLAAHPDADVAGMADEEVEAIARKRCLALIERDLERLSVRFDTFYSEKSLYEQRKVFDTLERLRASGRTYRAEGAEWLSTTPDGDDEDRVLVKKDGSLTYLAPDLAYHDDKFRRGYDRYINIFGSDHVGYVARLKSGISALGHDASKLSVLVLRLVFLTSRGERLKGSKRSGNIVLASEILDQVGPDAIRFFLLERSTDSEIEFDLDLAREESDRNPVFKVQYAHARIHSVTVKAKLAGLLPEKDPVAAAARLRHPTERDLVFAAGEFPAIVARCGEEHAPHHLPKYLLNLAELWNRFWSAAKKDDSLRIIRPEDPATTAARLMLADCVRQTIANGLRLLAIDAPERLVRDEEA
jgi:arginyl-tRNA synthetase